jgi:hypothetical protein
MLDRASARHPCGRQTKTRQHNFYFASNQIFKDLRSGTRDPFGKRIPCRPRKPFGQGTLQKRTRMTPSRNFGNLKELLQIEVSKAQQN